MKKNKYLLLLIISLFWINVSHGQQFSKEEFRNISGRMEPEMWDPHTGNIMKVPTKNIGNITQVQLNLQSYHSCFLVCKQKKF